LHKKMISIFLTILLILSTFSMVQPYWQGIGNSNSALAYAEKQGGKEATIIPAAVMGPPSDGGAPPPSEDVQQGGGGSGEGDIMGTFIVNVVNDNGGTKQPSDFTINILAEGGTANPSSFAGSASGTGVSLSQGGNYNLGINTEPGYTRTLGSDCPAQMTQSFTCTITFNDSPLETLSPEQAPLAQGKVWPLGTFIVKVLNDIGGTKQPSDFTVNILAQGGGTATPSSFPGSESGTQVELAGEGASFTLETNKETGYSRNLGSDCPTPPQIPSTFTCTILYDDVPSAMLPPGNNGTIEGTFIVKVINDDGGTLNPEDFTITWYVESGPGSINPSSFKGQGPPGTQVLFKKTGPGNPVYSVMPPTEPGYTRIAGAGCPEAGKDFPSKFTCTAVYDDLPQPKQQKQIKGTYIIHVNNNYGGTLKAEDLVISLTVKTGDATPMSILGSETGQTVTFTSNPQGVLQFQANLEFPPGYKGIGSPECVFKGTLQDFTCTIDIYELPPLKITKTVINDDGQGRTPAEFTIRVTGDPEQEFKLGNNIYSDVVSFQGSPLGTEVRLGSEGKYNVTEVPDKNYDTTYSSGCSGNITAGPDLTPAPPECVITNNDKKSDKATIIVDKYVANDNGGTKEPWDFTIHITGVNAVPNDFRPSQQDVVVGGYSGYSRVTSTTVKVDPGQYNVSEDLDPQYDVFYSPYSECAGQIMNGQTKYCVIINDDKSTITPTNQNGTLTVYKVLYNNNGGISRESDFEITVRGDNNRVLANFRASPTGTTVNVPPGNYFVEEAQNPRYSSFTSETGCFGRILPGENKVCVITNDDVPVDQTTTRTPEPGTISVRKYVINNNGGTKQASDFVVTVINNNVDLTRFRPSSAGDVVNVQPGTFSVNEVLDPNYITTRLGCEGSISATQALTCTIINDDKPPFVPQITTLQTQTATIRVIKNVINDNDGTRQASDFLISIPTGNNPSPSVFFGNAQGTNVRIAPGPYRVLEPPETGSGSGSGYTSNPSRECSGVISAGETKTCTITNNDIPPNNARLVVTKTVINDNGGTKQASDFRIRVDGNGASPNVFPGRASPGTVVNLRPGSYFVTEPDRDPKYRTNIPDDCRSDRSGNIAPGETRYCNITNTYVGTGTFGAQSAVRIVKNVINDNGGTKQASGFSISITGNNPDINLIQGSPSPGQIVTMDPGPYTVTEQADPSYTTTPSAGCQGTLAVGEIRECVLTNNDIGTGTGTGTGTGAGGLGTGPGAAGGGPNATAPGALNSTQLANLGAGQILIIKEVVNDNNGTKQPSDFTMSITGNSPSQTSAIGRTAPGTAVTLKPGQYTISETLDPKYRTSYSADCIGTIAVGETKICTVTNNDKPAGLFGAQTALIITKNLVNDNGGTKQASDFVVTVTGNNSSPNLFVAPAAPNQTLVEIDPGNYNVKERNDTGYNTRYTPSCQGNITLGETKVCSIINDDNLLGASIPIEVETLKFGRSVFPANGTIVLADVSPLEIIGGHVLLNLPNNDSKLVATQLSETGAEHAVIVPLTKVPGTGKSLYRATLEPDANGTNPFTGKSDNMSRLSELVLWNNASGGVSFDDDHGVTSTLILSKPKESIGNVSSIDVETLKFGRSQFPANGTIVLADVSPSKVIEGHVLLNIPNNNDVNLVAAKLTENGVEHAVTVPLIKVFDPRTGERLYHTELQPSLNGTNPFTGKADNISSISDILLYSTNPSGVSFDEDHGSTLTLILGKPEVPIGSVSTIDVETLKFGRSQFPANGTIVLADILSPLQIVGGHALLNLPTISSNDTKLIAARLAENGEQIEHAIAVPLTKVSDPRTGERLSHADIQKAMNGTNPFTGMVDSVENITDILIWNNATSDIAFEDDSGVTVTLLLNDSDDTASTVMNQISQGPSTSVNIPGDLSTSVNTTSIIQNNTANQTGGSLGQNGTSITQNISLTTTISTPINITTSADRPSSIDTETIKFGRSQLPANGTIVIAGVSPLQIVKGHVMLNIPNNDTKLVAARINDTGIEHAVIVPLLKAFEPRTGEFLYHGEIQSTMNGTNPYTGAADLVDRVTDLVLWNNATSGVSFDDDNGLAITFKLEEAG
jgi:Prealbumin-like fold domain